MLLERGWVLPAAVPLAALDQLADALAALAADGLVELRAVLLGGGDTAPAADVGVVVRPVLLGGGGATLVADRAVVVAAVLFLYRLTALAAGLGHGHLGGLCDTCHACTPVSCITIARHIEQSVGEIVTEWARFVNEKRTLYDGSTMWQEQNQKTIKKGLKIIAGIPFTRAVFLTGSLAEGRASAKSDIDFFIQVEPGYLWSTRFFVTLFLQLARIRRTDTDITGKICLNWFAIFNAPAQQNGRVYKLLWQQKPTGMKLILEKLISVPWGKWLEKLLKNYQISRIERDPRTHQPGSQVRYSDTELGFHPPK